MSDGLLHTPVLLTKHNFKSCVANVLQQQNKLNKNIERIKENIVDIAGTIVSVTQKEILSFSHFKTPAPHAQKTNRKIRLKRDGPLYSEYFTKLVLVLKERDFLCSSANYLRIRLLLIHHSYT